MTKWDVYDWVIERIKYGDWLEAYNEAVRIDGYEYDVFYHLREIGIIEIKMEVNEDKLKQFEEMIEDMRRNENDDSI